MYAARPSWPVKVSIMCRHLCSLCVPRVNPRVPILCRHLCSLCGPVLADLLKYGVESCPAKF